MKVLLHGGCILDIILYPSSKKNIYVVKISYFKHFFNFFPVEYFLFGCFQFLMLYLHAGVCIFLGSFFLLKSVFELWVSCPRSSSISKYQTNSRFGDNSSLLKINCSVVGWASHLLFTFPQKTCLKNVLKVQIFN